MIFLFYIAVFLHLFVYLKRFLIIVRYHDSTSGQPLPAFSVLICAHNEEQNLRKLIPLVQAQDYPDMEIIVALDRSTDGSLGFLSGISRKDTRIKVLDITQIPDHFHGKKYAITRGIAAAQNDWILLTDADCRPASGRWIRCFGQKADENTQFILGISPYFRGKGFLNKVIGYETFLTAFFYSSSAMEKKPYMGVGRNLAYRKSVFQKTNGFYGFQHITGGDDDLFVQHRAHGNKTKVVFGKESLTYSAPKRKWSEYLTQKVRHLHAGNYYRSKTKQKHYYRAFLHLVLWLSFIYLISNNPMQWGVINTFFVLMVVKGLFFRAVEKKLGIGIGYLFIPLTDLVYAFFIPFTGVRTAFLKRVRWN